MNPLTFSQCICRCQSMSLFYYHFQSPFPSPFSMSFTFLDICLFVYIYIFNFHNSHFFPLISSPLFPSVSLSFLSSFSHLFPSYIFSFSLHSLPLISLLYIFSLTFSLSMSVKLSYPFLFNPLHPILSLFISVTSSSFLSPSSHSLPLHICLFL